MVLSALSGVDDEELDRLAAHLDCRSAEEIIAWTLERFGHERTLVCTSFQIEGMVILDIAARIDPTVRVATIDTGRLPAATHEMIDRVRDRYGLVVETFFPDPVDLEPMLRAHGSNLFYESEALRINCCDVRKVRPMRRLLSTCDAWFTGLRRGHSELRSDVQVVARDSGDSPRLKVSPLAHWTEDQVWDYAREHKVPTHPLYAKGYTSIGCDPCTRAIEPGEDSRAGRWWWESMMAKECGLHFDPYRSSSNTDEHAAPPVKALGERFL